MTSKPRAYLDTVLISAIVRNDLKPKEGLALTSLKTSYDRGELELVTSDVADEELGEIPSGYRADHLDVRRLFGTIPRVHVGGITRLGAAGLPTANPKKQTWDQLRRILPDENDAWHIFVAKYNRIEYLVTADESTILKHKDAIRQIAGVNALLPSEFEAWAWLKDSE